jgi:hypothetical protein
MGTWVQQAMLGAGVMETLLTLQMAGRKRSVGTLPSPLRRHLNCGKFRIEDGRRPS